MGSGRNGFGSERVSGRNEFRVRLVKNVLLKRLYIKGNFVRFETVLVETVQVETVCYDLRPETVRRKLNWTRVLSFLYKCFCQNLLLH
ncbi:hypothetical protein Hanom_Chr04g00300211 [Helianthus anomalus]